MKHLESEKLTQEILQELMHYDPLSGIFTWKERDLKYFSHCMFPQRACNIWNVNFSGKEAGNIWTHKNRKTSYTRVRISLNGRNNGYQAHRLAFLYLEGYFPSEQVDHIDGDGTNNRKVNLRKVNNQENNKNMPMSSRNTSGVTGVYWNKAVQKWQVSICVDGKNIHSGLFINKKEAIAKRKELEIEHGYHKNHGRTS